MARLIFFGAVETQASVNLTDVGGIATAEAFGEPTVDTSAHVNDAGAIASLEALGSPALAVALSPAGIATAEAVGSPALAAALSAVGAIASSESVGAPALAVSVASSAIATAEAFGEPTVTEGQAGINLTDVGGILSAESIGTPTLTPVAVAARRASGLMRARPYVPPVTVAHAVAVCIQEPQTTTCRVSVRKVARGAAASAQPPQSASARGSQVFRVRARITQAPVAVTMPTARATTPDDDFWAIVAMLETNRAA